MPLGMSGSIGVRFRTKSDAVLYGSRPEGYQILKGCLPCTAPQWAVSHAAGRGTGEEKGCESVEELEVWSCPVTLPDVAPPRTEEKADCLYGDEGDGMELLRCWSEGPGLILPDSVSDRPVISVGAGAMSGNDSLTCVVLPRYLHSIGPYAFYGCQRLEEVHIPAEVQSIGALAFAGCRGLKSLYVPPTVEQIGEGAFEGAENVVLTGMEDSAIHHYAEENGLFFMTSNGPAVA